MLKYKNHEQLCCNLTAVGGKILLTLEFCKYGFLLDLKLYFPLFFTRVSEHMGTLNLPGKPSKNTK